jgi:hypothetical protein
VTKITWHSHYSIEVYIQFSFWNSQHIAAVGKLCIYRITWYNHYSFEVYTVFILELATHCCRWQTLSYITPDPSPMSIFNPRTTIISICLTHLKNSNWNRWNSLLYMVIIGPLTEVYIYIQLFELAPVFFEVHYVQAPSPVFLILLIPPQFSNCWSMLTNHFLGTLLWSITSTAWNRGSFRNAQLLLVHLIRNGRERNVKRPCCKMNCFWEC